MRVSRLFKVLVLDGALLVAGAAGCEKADDGENGSTGEDEGDEDSADGGSESAETGTSEAGETGDGTSGDPDTTAETTATSAGDTTGTGSGDTTTGAEETGAVECPADCNADDYKIGESELDWSDGCSPITDICCWVTGMCCDLCCDP